MTDQTTIIEVSAPIREVVVYEDRAQVTRRAEVALAVGQQVLRVPGLTPLLCDRTLRCQAPDSSRLLDLQVERTYQLHESRPRREQELRQALKERVSRYHEALDQAKVRYHERGLLEMAAEELLAQLQERLTVGAVGKAWAEELDELGQRAASLEQKMLAQQWEQDDRRSRISRALEQLTEVLSPAPEYTAALLTSVQVGEGAGEVEISWQYQVPCALWRPAYDAELCQAGADGAATVTWRSHGTVWQRTGEAWDDVALTFSTERPALGAKLPLLSDDLLSLREKSRREREVLEIESRDQVIQRADDVPDASQQDDTPPGLDDGGEPRSYKAQAAVSIPSDGRPHRVQVLEWQADAELELACLPEKASFVFLRSFQVNPGDLPLLAGPVNLGRDGGYVGRSRIGYVAPAQRFAISWGSDDNLTVLRQVSDEQRRGSLLGQRREELTHVKLVVANQGAAPVEIELYERMPVSEIEAVKVRLDRDETTAGYHLDDQGLVNWKLELGAGQEEEVRLTFSVSLPDRAQVSE